MIRYIAFLGPPSCGKDKATKYVLKHGKNFSHYKVSTPLKRVFDSVLMLGHSTATKFIEKAKDIPQPLLKDKTPRQVQIDYFHALQTAFGDQILGEIAVRELRGRMSNVVLSDSSPIELPHMFYQLGRNNFLTVQIEREGTNYDNDIRGDMSLLDGYMRPEHPQCKIENKYDLEMYEHQIINILKKYKLFGGED